MKRDPRGLPRGDDFRHSLVCGDIHPNSLDHFCAWVEEVIAPILKNERNLDKFPKCVADDIKRQVHELSTAVYQVYIRIIKLSSRISLNSFLQIRGHIKGKTLLPFPQQGAKIIEQEEAKVYNIN